MTPLQVAASLVWLDNKPISFADRPYLTLIHDRRPAKLVLRCSRQVEKSTTLAILLLLNAAQDPGSTALVVLPRQEQLRVFRDTKLLPILHGSPALKRLLAGRGSRITATQMLLANGAQIHLRAAFNSADAARGISCSFLVLDEFQDMSPDALPVLEQALAHARTKRILMAGTPKLVDNPLEKAYGLSTKCEWIVACPACGTHNKPDGDVIGPQGTICRECSEPIDFRKGEWRSYDCKNSWGDGYWINHLMVPWMNYQEILSYRESYDPVRFSNEVLGLPSTLGDHLVTEEQVLACCTNRSQAEGASAIRQLGIMLQTLTVGIDWSGGSASRTAIVVGGHDMSGHFHVLHVQALPPQEGHDIALAEVGKVLMMFPGARVAADGNGNGAVLNRELLNRRDNPAKRITAIYYAGSMGTPQEVTSSEVRWTVDRTRVLSDIYTRIKANKITFPHQNDVAGLLADLWHETAEYDPQQRSLRYFCSPGHLDDVLHAMAYSLAVSGYIAGKIHGGA